MGRDVDERKKRAALRKLRKAAELAEQGKGPPLSDWERQFLEEVEERIEKYGSAFADPMKGDEGEALSALQRVKLKEIDKKARGKARSGFRAKGGSGKGQQNKGFSNRPTPRVRNIDEDIEDDVADEAPEAAPPVKSGKAILKAVPRETPSDAAPVPYTETTPQARPSGRPAFRVIEGGKSKPED